MTWIALVLLTALSVLAFGLGRRKAKAAGRGHSRPAYQGAYVALWAVVPAGLLLSLVIAFGGRIEHAMLAADAPAAVAQLPPEQQEVFYGDARAIAKGAPTSGTYDASPLKADLDATAAKSQRQHQIFLIATLGLAVALALGGFALALSRLTPAFRARNRVEGWVSGLLIACSGLAILTTVGIVASLAFEALRFFQSVSPLAFLGVGRPSAPSSSAR